MKPKTLVKIALSTAAISASSSVSAGNNCSTLDIPECIGWKMVCPHHAPDFNLTFTSTGLELKYFIGPNAQTQVDVLGSYTPGTVTAGPDPSTSFTTNLGVSGSVKYLSQQNCIDGHFFDGASFELSIATAPAGATLTPGATACCRLQPH